MPNKTLAKNIPKSVARMTEGLTKSIAYENGASTNDSQLYMENLPKGISPKQAETISIYNEAFICATGIAVNDNIVNADSPTDVFGNDQSAVASWGMGDNTQVNHIVNKTENGWKSFTEVSHELSSSDLLDTIHQSIDNELNR